MSSQLFVCRGIDSQCIQCNKQLRRNFPNPFLEFPCIRQLINVTILVQRTLNVLKYNYFPPRISIFVALLRQKTYFWNIFQRTYKILCRICSDNNIFLQFIFGARNTLATLIYIREEQKNISPFHFESFVKHNTKIIYIHIMTSRQTRDR